MKTLDPTEKGAVSYFIGMTFCKVFATRLLNTPWLLHLDVFRPQLNPVLTARSRPDLVGLEHGTTKWHAFECKGRISPPDSATKTKAKEQAQRLVSVNGIPCTLHVGAITYFRSDVLQFYWRDPPPVDGNQLNVQFTPDAWHFYYSPIVQAIVAADDRVAMERSANTFVAVHGLDLEVSIHPVIARFLFRGEWERAHLSAVEAASEIAEAGYRPDGLLVKSGQKWSERFEDFGISAG